MYYYQDEPPDCMCFRKAETTNKPRPQASNDIWVGKFTDPKNAFTLVESSKGYVLHAAGSSCDMCAVEATEMPGVILGSCANALVFKKSSASA
jgi:hypothetical protein|eukprot:COSAG06_NODE_5090_length_3726_cov_7.050455_3_plen_93_part_00